MTTKINFNQIKGEVVNILDFGAVTDGSAYVHTEIQAAIDSLTPAKGGTIYIPNATYNLNASLSIPDGMEGLNFVGESMIGTILQYAPATGDMFTRAGAFSYSSIRNMFLKASGTHTAGWCMDFNYSALGTAYDITGIDQADPAKVYSATTPLTGTYVYISGVAGMTQVNDNYYVVGTVALNTSFTLLDPNTGAVVSTNYGAWSSGGTWQQVTGVETTRELEISDVIIQHFQNGIRAGATLNTLLRRMRVIGRSITPALPADAIGIQIGDAGHEGTTTTIENVYCLAASGSAWGIGLWNKWCYGLLLNPYITDACQIGLRNDASVDGFMHSETTTASIAGTGSIKIHALNDNAGWGTIGAAYGDIVGLASAGLWSSRIRVWRDPAIRVQLQTSLVFGVGYTPGSGYAALVFDSDIYNAYGYMASGAYTVQVPGMYRIHAQVAWFDTLVTNDRRIRLVMIRGGTTYEISEQIHINLISASGAGYVYATIEGIYPCLAGDKLYLQHSAITNAGSGPVADGGIVGFTTESLSSPATFIEIAQAW